MFGTVPENTAKATAYTGMYLSVCVCGVCVCGCVFAKSVFSSTHLSAGGSIFEESGAKPKVALLDTDDLFLPADTQQPAHTGDLDVEDNSEILE